MDFSLGKEAEAFQQEVQDFLEKEIPADWGGYEEESAESEQYWAFSRSFGKKLGAKGRLALGWPREYGGGARSWQDQFVFAEEMGYYGAPFYSRTVSIVGAVIITHGSEAQKKTYLPKIASGEIEFCILLTEPGYGSDLAGAQCRAEEDANGFTIEGQKTFISNAHHAEYGILLARTAPQLPKHRGLSVFIIDMQTPGITVRPLINMVGFHCFNEVFFDQVRVSQESLVGERNSGWYYMMTGLDHERTVHGSGIARAAFYKHTLEDLVAYVREAQQKGLGLSTDPLMKHKLAELAIEIGGFRSLCCRMAWQQSQGHVPDYQAAMTKLFGSEFCRRLADVVMQITGLYGQLSEGSKWAPLRGKMARMYLSTMGVTIAGGSAEILRNIMAIRGLELPR